MIPYPGVRLVKTRYGWVEINHVRYDHDIIIHPDQKITKRSKKKSRNLKKEYGHTPLSEHDLVFLKKESPAVIFIGTGQFGDMPITREAHKILSRFDTCVSPTPEILDRIAEESRPFAAVLHVSC
jgi:hypothetical protein